MHRSSRNDGADNVPGRASKLRQRKLPALCCGDIQTTLIDGATMTALPNTRDALGESWTTAGRRARRIARHSRHAAEDIASELRTLMNELENTLGDGTQADAAVLRTQMRKRLDEARSRLNDTRDAMRERAEAALHDADDYVHENPWRTIAIVGGVALIAGALIARGGGSR
ncbi:hypothetical protein CBA19C8_38720 [Paraburkholderia terrae]|nr:hypothetical protein CBA19C8_38720 [Paraburkholderia terrae]